MEDESIAYYFNGGRILFEYIDYLMEDYFKYDRYYLITKKKYIWNIIDDFKSIANSSISKVGFCIRNEI